jgi:hypothetical protein
MRSDLPPCAEPIGDGHWITYYTVDRERWPEAPEHTGIIEWHRRPDGELCGGWVAWWRPPGQSGPVWQLVALDPLHLEPSILCSPDKDGCGMHGFIRDGRWVDA